MEQNVRSASLPAITLWQPWASLVAAGVKPFETRGWPPPRRLIGARVAIHAARRPTERDFDPATAAAIAAALNDPGWPDLLPRGAVLCSAVLAGAYRVGEETAAGHAAVIAMVPGSPAVAAIDTDPFGDFSPGRWVWRLREIVPVEPPVPARGHQGWWRWTG